MKKLFAVVVCVVLGVSSFAFSQSFGSGLGLYDDPGNSIYGGVGLVSIDSEGESGLFYNVMFRPELAFGKFGIGLYVNLNINTETGEIRDEDWNEPQDYWRMIRYMRYGLKSDPFYVRVGTLDAARLGHGSALNYYTNAASYDDRKLGMAFDWDFGTFGFESITSSFERAEVIALRGYVRPLQKAISVPIIKNIAVGASAARDFNPDDNAGTDDAVTVYGVDVEVPVFKNRLINTMLYYDWSQIHGYSFIEEESRDFGHGQIAGLSLDFPALTALLDLRVKFERRWLSEEYVPSFFDAFYEIQRYQENGYRKADMLIGVEETVGWFGEVYGKVFGDMVRLVGNYAYYDNDALGGVMHLGAEAPDAVPVLAAHATYDKIGIETGEDLFTLDENSIARVGLGYKMNPLFTLYVDYIWTFAKRTHDGRSYYEPQERFEPRIVFNYTF